MKKCKKCGIEKPFEEFYKSRTNKDGHYGSCKRCHNDDNKEYRKNNKDRIVEYKKRYCKINKDRIANYYKGYRENKKDYVVYCFKVDEEIIYVGSTISSMDRLHKYNTSSYNKNYKNYNCLINTYIRDNNWNLDDIRNHFHVLESNVPEDQLRIREQHYIDLYHPSLNERNAIKNLVY